MPWEVEVLLYLFYNSIRLGWVVSTMSQLLYAQEMDPVSVILEAGWASGLVLVGEEDLASACSKLLYQLCCSSHQVILLWQGAL